MDEDLEEMMKSADLDKLVRYNVDFAETSNRKTIPKHQLWQAFTNMNTKHNETFNRNGFIDFFEFVEMLTLEEGSPCGKN